MEKNKNINKIKKFIQTEGEFCPSESTDLILPKVLKFEGDLAHVVTLMSKTTISIQVCNLETEEVEFNYVKPYEDLTESDLEYCLELLNLYKHYLKK